VGGRLPELWTLVPRGTVEEFADYVRESLMGGWAAVLMLEDDAREVWGEFVRYSLERGVRVKLVCLAGVPRGCLPLESREDLARVGVARVGRLVARFWRFVELRKGHRVLFVEPLYCPPDTDFARCVDAVVGLLRKVAERWRRSNRAGGAVEGWSTR
jgi:hypothetical protein